MPVYGGTFGEAQAERLLWRAGFGPRPGEVAAVAGQGLRDAVLALTRPGAARLTGAPPTDGQGRPIAPADAWGHDHLWWLDRMVRTNQPLVERMTLNWHDWFATGDVGASRLNLAQNATMRPSEWRLTLSRAAVRPGAAVIQLQNLGEDAHDLRARRIHPSRVAGGSTPAPAMASPETPSGDLSEVKVSLRPGRYRLWCSLPGHRQAGMQATLQVRRNPRPR